MKLSGRIAASCYAALNTTFRIRSCRSGSGFFCSFSPWCPSDFVRTCRGSARVKTDSPHPQHSNRFETSPKAARANRLLSRTLDTLWAGSWLRIMTFRFSSLSLILFTVYRILRTVSIGSSPDYGSLFRKNGRIDSLPQDFLCPLPVRKIRRKRVRRRLNQLLPIKRAQCVEHDR